jgi:hypothetical protein
MAKVAAAGWACTLALLLLSGCAARPDAGTKVPTNGGQVELKAAAPTVPSKGSISGVVVDAAIRPVAGANLTILGPQLHAATDRDGLFTFSDLEPGLYTLSANATGFLATQTTAEVKAGATAKVRMVLPLDTSPKPYHTVLKYDGYIQAGSGLENEAWDLFVGEETGVFSCTCRFNFTADQAVSSFIFETTWEPTVADPAAPQDAYWTIYGPDSKGGETYESGDCLDPCWGQANGTTYAPTARDFYAYVWLDSSWVVVQQKFTVYVTLFYNGMPPAGWSFVKGDT